MADLRMAEANGSRPSRSPSGQFTSVWLAAWQKKERSQSLRSPY